MSGGELRSGAACLVHRRQEEGEEKERRAVGGRHQTEHSKSSPTAARSLAQVQRSAYTRRRRHEKEVERKRKEGRRKEGANRSLSSPQSAQIGSDGGGGVGGGGGRQDVKSERTDGEERDRVTEQSSCDSAMNERGKEGRRRIARYIAHPRSVPEPQGPANRA